MKVLRLGRVPSNRQKLSFCRIQEKDKSVNVRQTLAIGFSFENRLVVWVNLVNFALCLLTLNLAEPALDKPQVFAPSHLFPPSSPKSHILS